MNKTVPILFLLSYVVGGGFSLVVPKIRTFREKREDLLLKKETLGNREEYIEHLVSLSEELERREEEMEKVSKAFPDHPETSWLAEFLEKVTPQSGMTLKEVGSFSTSVSETSTGQKIVETKLRIKVNGSYTSFLNFLETLEKSVRLIEVENITFSAVLSEEQGEENFEGEFEELEEGSEEEERKPTKMYDFSLTCKVRSGEFNFKN